MFTPIKALSLLAVSAALSACAPTTTAMIGGANAGNGGLMPSQRLSVAQPSASATAMSLRMTSPTISNGTALPMANVGSGNGCTGMNVSPALSWGGAPDGTMSYVLTMYDPDAPTGSGFWHWSVYNIPASVTTLAEGAGSAGGTLPAGAMQLNNDGGGLGYTGACPPVGDRAHRYVITLYALSKTITLPGGATPAYLGFNLNGATLAKTSLTAFYGR
ncbi:YbhB/YbcL family Raf kinase inhibitor-like protein [Deinococcus sp.]|uniref:YbhB/YbcL family Raf kinase inhibitor-like protein n=1 Tax=Deinococcus sp. TaxID=47478 RepID=UPI002869E589|nr:YbhB/YbcL family Raf kinase inhibitor-like protein [Deinococcus sp.]